VMTDPMSAFRVGRVHVHEGGISLDQEIDAALVDHRGRVEMPAYAVVAESVTSGAYWYAFRESVATVQAWLAMTAGAPARIGDSVHAVAHLTHHDESHGIATMTVTNDTDDVVCSGVARAVRVGRMSDALLAIDRDDLPHPSKDAATPPVNRGTPPAPIPESWDGARVLAAIRDGAMSAGPLCDLLAMTLVSTADAPVLVLQPQPFMANPLGAIQGGVMASIIGQACSLAGQAHTGPGDDYRLADLSVYYFRSPLVDAGPLTLTTATDRVGRRLATVSATMSDSAGTVCAKAVANIAYRRFEK
jgi:acyl-coenzyme A thioesterase PaaI-like protein